MGQYCEYYYFQPLGPKTSIFAPLRKLFPYIEFRSNEKITSHD